tara:strand:- start:1303 stop:2937 length:1635 start_codon:yes stop_codon:yes gene_type:complete
MDLCQSSADNFSQSNIDKIQKLCKKNISKIMKTSKNNWINNVYEYIHLAYTKNIIQIIEIKKEKVNQNNKINILKLLKIFCTDSYSLITQEHKIDDKYVNKVISILNSCLLYQASKNKLSKQLKYKIRKYIEIDENGKKLLKLFFNKLLQTNIIDSNYRLLFNPYTSIINLNEIYLQIHYQYIINVKLTKDFRISDQDTFFEDRIIIFTPDNKSINKMVSNSKSKKTYSSTNKLIHEDSDYLKELLIRCFLFNYLLKTNMFPHNMIIYLIDYKKEMMQIKNKKDIIFTPSEINTGVTNGRQIIITRFEEALKTIVHELIHYHDLDFKDIPEFLSQYCLKKFQIHDTLKDLNNNPVLNIFEAYTEAFASIINCMFFSYLNPINSELNLQTTKELIKYNTRIKNSLKNHISYQILYTIVKICSILKVIGCSSLSQFSNNNNSSLSKSHKTNINKQCSVGLVEETNVFCYYFIKLYFYMYLDELFIKNTKINIGKFIISVENFNNLKVIIEKGSQNKFINELVTDILNKNNQKINKEDKTLKMVCLA